MISRPTASLVVAALLSGTGLRAAEGMWLPSQAPAMADRLKAAGLRLPAEALSDLSAAPMSAIASLGGCSASFVSPQGLVVTNHHCAYGSIQFNATPERDLIRQGFVAPTRADELPAAPGSRVFVIRALDNVTADMMAGVRPALTGEARVAKLEANRKAMIAACEAEPGIRCDVRSYFGGTEYWRQTMLEILDVRLVYAPASGIGNFGGEIDNWQWPRHTGDFAFYRAYVGPDGKPAPFSKDNVPYRPAAHLKLASGDLKEGDFVLIAGFPGVTERYRTAAETKGWYTDIYPTQQRLLADYSALIETTATTPEEKIAYASILKGSDNYKKKIAGQMEVAAREDLVGRKEAEGATLGLWAARPENRATHGLAIANYDSLAAEALAADRARLVNATLNRAQLLAAARSLFRWANEREKPDAAREPGYQDRDRQSFVDRLSAIDRRYVAKVDRAMLEQALAETAKLPEASRNMALETYLKETGLDRLYGQTRLHERSERLAWLDRPVADFTASTDPFIQAAVAGFKADMLAEARRKSLEGRLDAARVPFMAAVRAHAAATGKLLYPDANGSLRFTYGHVAGRELADGVRWTAFTTQRGILAKDSGKDPFDSPPKLLALLRAGDFPKSPSLGALPVNFLSTTDITNGNSGSAILDATGELVGLAFDGTLEGMLSDWSFDDATTRTIGVDARYMRFVMERVDNAGHLVAEMEGR
jgi:hypothetical protein